MSGGLHLRHDPAGWIEIGTCADRPLWRYVYRPGTPANEAPRPYAHPVYSIDGDVMTNFRPNDHPWHHGLSLTMTRVDGVNFWGGPSYRAEDGYQWREDQGVQRHREWRELTAGRMEERVDWEVGVSGRVLMEERRELMTTVSAGGWGLRWTSELRNVTAGALTLGNYEASAGLVGSHYTGLQFRGARDLLDEHGDGVVGMRSLAGEGEAAVHGGMASRMEWSCQHDGSLRRTRICFESGEGPIPWFVRAKNPLAAWAFHREHEVILPPGERLRLDHRLTFFSI
ncbi:MAG: hypothetical protein RL077_533 [Verrucomicrobiota bacterium]|jgi:hypothetical protein